VCATFVGNSLVIGGNNDVLAVHHFVHLIKASSQNGLAA
jgi:hypothetical protein